ncbi:MAG: hypothetical protein EPO26_07200 [Chloroflexota bacterium]|nr:MAG: hypothetical protein EPO26_07200 [Chloroflexota bacterium]
MKSVRLGPERDEQLARAAQAEGLTESEYIRRALDRALAEFAARGTLRERLSDVIGSVRSSGGVARRTSEAFAELMDEERKRP